MEWRQMYLKKQYIFKRDILKSPGTSLVTFADDTILLAKRNKQEQARRVLQIGFDHLQRSLNKWIMKFNAQKTQAILIGLIGRKWTFRGPRKSLTLETNSTKLEELKETEQ